MNTFGVDLTKCLPSNQTFKLNVCNQKNSAIKPNKVSLIKDDAGRIHYNYDRPIRMNIDGHTIPNISSYSVINYNDSVTKNGKLYDIKTAHSNISLYTYDNKFAIMKEYFHNPKSLNINGKNLYGHVTKTIFKDGNQRYEVITPNHNIKIIDLDAFGKELISNKPKQIQAGNNMFKKVCKLLKFVL